MLELSSKRRRPFVGVVFHWAHTFQRSRPHQNDIRHEPKLTGSGYPHRRSGSEADSMSRGGYPVAGRPSSKSSSIGHIRSNEAALTRATPDRNRSAPGAGTPTGDFWKRSGQHEPRRVPGHGAPSIEVVFHQTHAVSEAAPSVGSLLLLRRYGDGRRLPPQLPQHIPVRPRH